jgi:hypothetical protein
VIIRANLIEILERAALAITMTINAISQMAYRTEKKYPKSESPTNCLSNNAAIIEVNPSPKIAESNSSIARNFLPLPIALGIAMKANG